MLGDRISWVNAAFAIRNEDDGEWRLGHFRRLLPALFGWAEAEKGELFG
jgi:hypothetical protein